MKLISYNHDGEEHVGALLGDEVINLAGAVHRRRGDSPLTMLDLLSGGEDALNLARAGVERTAAGGADGLRLADVRLLPPVPRPPKIICVGRNYAAHAREAGNEPPAEFPILFSRFAATLLAHGQPVVRPFVSHELDWEGELAVVIGRGGRHITRERALEHVAGYSAFNDVSVRNYQFRTSQFLAGKNFSASAPFGPCLVTRDELPDPQALELRTFIDEEQVQHGRTADMLFDVRTIIEHLSEFIALEPGDVIATGTPSGVGFARKPPRFLVPGETVRVEITGVGTLSNPVVDEERPADGR